MDKLGAIIAMAVCLLVLLNISTVFAFLFLLVKIALVVGLLALAGFLVFGFIEKPEKHLPPLQPLKMKPRQNRFLRSRILMPMKKGGKGKKKYVQFSNIWVGPPYIMFCWKMTEG